MPSRLQGLLVGESTEADVMARFPAATVRRDTRLGGEENLTINGAPAVLILHPGDETDPASIAFILTAEGDSSAKLVGVSITAAGTGPTLCSWVRSTIGPLEGSRVLPGSNRRLADYEDFVEYAIGTPDGSRAIMVKCESEPNRETLRYLISGPSGFEMAGDFSGW